jgi:glycosyltransferase involved in cell wall biosynthesis
LKLAYLVGTPESGNIDNPNYLAYFIVNSLKNIGFEIFTAGNENLPFPLKYKIYTLFYKKILRMNYSRWREPSILKIINDYQIEDLRNVDYDGAICFGTLQMAYLDIQKPIFIWTDATFENLLNFYPDYLKMPEYLIKHSHFIEKKAFDKCRLAIFTSDWAAQSAIKYYNIEPLKVKIVPFGANLVNQRTKEDILNIIDHKEKDLYKFLFIGKSWERKGGAIAQKIIYQLNKNGIKAELHVIGCYPNEKYDPTMIKVYGLVSKSNHEGANLINRLFSESHFFILPTKADASPHVLCEAASFGLPSITSNVGGVPEIVINNQNGMTFPLDCPISAYCDYIQDLLSDPRKYEDLCLSSFYEYETRLNWNVNAKKVFELIEESLNS